MLERLGHTPPAEAEKAYYASIAKWHLNRSQFGIRIDHDLAAFFKVVVAFCNKITLRSLFFWIQVDF
ncbi:hypothetical protein C9Z13_24600 [Escherichia coli]|nr:hypothetical protein C9Z13_24600 [Escherichia coli]